MSFKNYPRNGDGQTKTICQYIRPSHYRLQSLKSISICLKIFHLVILNGFVVDEIPSSNRRSLKSRALFFFWEKINLTRTFMHSYLQLCKNDPS